jgi:multidrug efflux system membrane fusion protein
MRRVALLIVFLGLVGAAVYVYRVHPEWVDRVASLIGRSDSEARSVSDSGRKGRAAPQNAVPVVIAAATRKTVPITFSTIGTVTATASIPLISQVSGMVAAVKVADGAKVNQGEVIVEIDARLIDTQIEQAQAAIVRDNANIDKAKRDLSRIERLIKSKFETTENLANAQTALDLANATLTSDQAALHNLEVQREYYSIRAPVTGRIGLINVKPGAFVMANSPASPIATLNSFDPIYVSVGIPQKMIAELAEDRDKGLAKVRLTVPGRDEQRDGPVSVIGNAAEPATGLVTVLASIKNDPPALWPNETVNVDVIFRDEPNALVVPGDAVATNQQGNYVYTVDETGHAHVSPVVVSRNVGTLAMVARGLNDGDRVVVDGQLQLSDGALVAVKQAMKE